MRVAWSRTECFAGKLLALARVDWPGPRTMAAPASEEDTVGETASTEVHRAEKHELVLVSLRGQKPMTELCREDGISDGLLRVSPFRPSGPRRYHQAEIQRRGLMHAHEVGLARSAKLLVCGTRPVRNPAV